MSESSLRPTVFKVVNEYARKLGILNPVFTVTEASKNGESYSGEVYRIVVTPGTKDIEDHNNNNSVLVVPREIRLIAKIPPKSKLRRQMYNSARHFGREKYVYEQIFPAFESFQRKHLPEIDVFQSYPKMMGASVEHEDEYVLLNDLSSKGYQNVDRPTPLDFDKSVLVLTNLAKFHAISFAFKDQHPEEFKTLTSRLEEIMFVAPVHNALEGFLKKTVEYSLTTLDAEKDTQIVQKMKDFSDIYAKFMVECCAEKEDAIVLHGDCWISNMMFKKNMNKDELNFLDWQVSRCGTVAIDLAYFIFCCTDSNLRVHLPQLLEVYHKTLVDRITELGSDGHALFPFEKLTWHMQKYSRFGLGMALMTLHATCCKSNEMADVQASLDALVLTNIDDYALPMIKNPVYIKRMSDVCKDFVRLNYL